MTRNSEVVLMNAAVRATDDNPVSNGAAIFIANELIPMMLGFWPKSSNQINGNLTGSAMAYGLMTKGFSAKEIRAVIIAQAETSREFAPTPQELKQLCQLANCNQEDSQRPEASIRALELQAQVKALNGEISDSEVAGYVKTLTARYETKGFVVTGRIG